MSDTIKLERICRLLRHDILTATTAAGSGHPTSSLSAVELMASLFFGGILKYNIDDPQYIFNDRIIFSKGHASPLLYSLFHVAGAVTEKELLTLRQFGSHLEGHPTPSFPYADVTTGSLGQGLSIGLGMALGINLHLRGEGQTVVRKPKIFVLLGDSEMAEGQNWEAIQVASHYKVNNLVGIIDMNRIGQRGETMTGWDEDMFQKRLEAFGWKTYVIENGHNLEEIMKVYQEIEKPKTKHDDKPIMIIAKTIKGKGISFLENTDGWHGKPVPQEKLESALIELGDVDKKIQGTIAIPKISIPVQGNQEQKVLAQLGKYIETSRTNPHVTNYTLNVLPKYSQKDLIATRQAYGDAILALGTKQKNLVILDAEMANSLYEEEFGKKFPERYFEMFIAEQNMLSVALGLNKTGFIPISASFGSFLSRAFDQIRMAQYSLDDEKHDHPFLIAGSHVGVSIGPDGASQMALEDIAMMRSILNSIIFYPSDAVSTFKLVEQLLNIHTIGYLRLTREKLPIIYKNDETFEAGGSKTLRHSDKDIATIFAAGITLHEALKAYEELKKQNIHVAIVDLYSVKPIDQETIRSQAKKTKHIIVVEDHYPYGGIGEAVLSALDSYEINFTHLAVNKIPHSGSPADLLRFEEIDAEAIVQSVRKLYK